VTQDVTNDGASVFFDMVFIFTIKSKLFCQHVLHSSQSMIIRVTSQYIFSGEVEVASSVARWGVFLHNWAIFSLHFEKFFSFAGCGFLG